MPGQTADAEHKKRIALVLDHILNHIDDPIPLQTLASVANYSSFHLQKVFKQIVGESPKQYILRLRLETAFHLLIIHTQKPIQAISIDSGFSSPAVFSRAMKDYFGHSPEQIRNLPHKEQMKLLHSAAPKSNPGAKLISDAPLNFVKPVIHTLKKAAVKGIYLTVPFDDPGEIQRSFQELSKIAQSHDWLESRPSMSGILSPHLRKTYKAFLPVNPKAAGAEKFPFTEIKGGRFATFKVQGDLRQTNKAAHYFYQRWLPESGFKIAGVTGFETFSENPASTPYYQLEREIHIPIEPAT